jgi:paraquat-inducible protein B
VFLNVSEMGLLDTERRGAIPEKVRIPVIIELDEQTLMRKGGRVKPDAETVKLLIDLGLRAQLATESFVTGLLYVKLDLYPGSPLKLVSDPTVEYAEIPTLPTPLEEAQMKAAKFLANLEQVDIKGLITSLNTALQSVNAIASSPGLHETLASLPDTMHKLDQSLTDMSATLASVRELSSNVDAKLEPTLDDVRSAANRAADALDATKGTLGQVCSLIVPDSPVLYELRRSLADLSAASRAIRRFAEDLERNPSVLVRGRAVEEESR